MYPFDNCFVDSFCDLFRDFLSEEDGITTVEIILILLVLIALVLVFKNQLTGLVNTILSKAVKQANQV